MAKVVIEKLEKVKMPDTGKGEWVSLRVSFNGKVASCSPALWNEGWQVGQEVDIETFEKVGKNGKVYLNIASPKNAEVVKETNESIALLREIRDILKAIKAAGVL